MFRTTVSKILRFVIPALLIVVVALVMAIAPATAHEERPIKTYTIAVGWQAEPAVVGVLNGPDVYVAFTDPKDANGDAKAALEALKVDLKVEVKFGDKSKTLILTPYDPVVDEYEGIVQARYVAPLIPTRAGDYTFIVTGTIGDVTVNETFTSADGKYSSIEPASDLLFPDTNVDAVSLQSQIDALKADIDALKAAKK